MSTGADKTPDNSPRRRRHLRRLRVANAQRVAELDLPSPCDVPALCRLLSEQRGRPITLMPMPIPASQPCGMWAAVADEDLIFVDSTTTGAHQDHIVLHELGHIICGHHGGSLLNEDSVRRLFPNLSSSLVQAMLSRAGYDDVDEQEAEIVAYLLWERISGAAGRPPGAPEDNDTLSRIERTLM